MVVSSPPRNLILGHSITEEAEISLNAAEHCFLGSSRGCFEPVMGDTCRPSHGVIRHGERQGIIALFTSRLSVHRLMGWATTAMVAGIPTDMGCSLRCR